MAAKLWTEIDGEPWLDNPRRRRRRKAKASHRRRRKASIPKGGSMARKRRRRPAAAGGVPFRRKGRRRGFRRNPILGGRGNLMRTVTEGVKGGLGVLAGKVAARAVPTLIGQPRTGMVGMAIQAAVAIVLAPMVGRFAGGEFGKAFLWGSFASPLESVVVKLNLPVIGPALSSYADELSAVPYVPGALAGPRGALPGFSVSEEDEFVQ